MAYGGKWGHRQNEIILESGNTDFHELLTEIFLFFSLCLSIFSTLLWFSSLALRPFDSFPPPQGGGGDYRRIYTPDLISLKTWENFTTVFDLLIYIKTTAFGVLYCTGTLPNLAKVTPVGKQWHSSPLDVSGKFYIESRNVRYEKFPVSVYRKNYTDIIGIPVFLW
jgi:hypothetical protein